MKGLAVLLAAAAAMLMMLDGCCGCQERDGLYDGMDEAVEEYRAASEIMRTPAEAPHVYGYAWPESEVSEAIANSSAPSDGVSDGDGVITPEQTGDAQFDAAYEDLMSVMDVEEIGMRSTYSIIP